MADYGESLVGDTNDDFEESFRLFMEDTGKVFVRISFSFLLLKPYRL